MVSQRCGRFSGVTVIASVMGMFSALAALDGALPHRAQIAAAECALAGFLRAVELEIELEFPVRRSSRARREMRRRWRGARRWCSAARSRCRVRVQPREQLEELRMQRRLAAGELENLDAALAVDHALDAPLARSASGTAVDRARRRANRRSRSGRRGCRSSRSRSARGRWRVSRPRARRRRGISPERAAHRASARRAGALPPQHASADRPARASRSGRRWRCRPCVRRGRRRSG